MFSRKLILETGEEDKNLFALDLYRLNKVKIAINNYLNYIISNLKTKIKASRLHHSLFYRISVGG